MTRRTGYKVIPMSFNRKAVIASATVTKEKNAIHCITEVDVTDPRRLISEHFTQMGEKLSFTAYLVTCLVHVIKDHPEMNSFHKGRNQIILDDISVNVLIEREIRGEKVPEPLGITKAQLKTYRQIYEEIREAQKNSGSNLGNLAGMTWIRFIPGFLLRTFIRIAPHTSHLTPINRVLCVIFIYSNSFFHSILLLSSFHTSRILKWIPTELTPRWSDDVGSQSKMLNFKILISIFSLM